MPSNEEYSDITEYMKKRIFQNHSNLKDSFVQTLNPQLVRTLFRTQQELKRKKDEPEMEKIE